MYLYTKDQMLNIFSAWKTEQDLPRKGEVVTITFPPTEPLKRATVCHWPKKSTYGRPLFCVQFFAV